MKFTRKYKLLSISICGANWLQKMLSELFGRAARDAASKWFFVDWRKACLLIRYLYPILHIKLERQK
jgi:hypothetical protein